MRLRIPTPSANDYKSHTPESRPDLFYQFIDHLGAGGMRTGVLKGVRPLHGVTWRNATARGGLAP